MFRLLVVVACVCSHLVSAVGASPTRGQTIKLQESHRTGKRTSQIYGIYPIFGRVTPSREIVSFMDYVFGVRRDNDNEEEETNAGKKDNASTVDSGELLRPDGPSVNANIGFEQYWHGGEWVYRKAELDRCNTTDDCADIGLFKVCAGNHDLTAHHTFNNICELDDANCRDGTVTVFTNTSVYNNSTIRWFPVTTSGYIDIKMSTATVNWFVLARTRNAHSRYKRLFYYGYDCWQWNIYTCVRLYKDEFYKPTSATDNRGMLMQKDYRLADPYYQRITGRHKDSRFFIRSQKVQQWKLSWNETTGLVQFEMILRNGSSYLPLQHQAREYAFPVRYIGLAGGNHSHPTWWELQGPGIPRGYLMAYRGKCREDIPPLPTEQPSRLRHNLDIDMYNFAERMDEFGYNYSRVPNDTVHYHDEDIDITYTPPNTK